MQLHASNFDQALAEFEKAIGLEIKKMQAARHAQVLTEIARLETRIERLRRQHKRTVEPLRELCELRARQIRFELAA